MRCKHMYSWAEAVWHPILVPRHRGHSFQDGFIRMAAGRQRSRLWPLLGTKQNRLGGVGEATPGAPGRAQACLFFSAFSRAAPIISSSLRWSAAGCGVWGTGGKEAHVSMRSTDSQVGQRCQCALGGSLQLLPRCPGVGPVAPHACRLQHGGGRQAGPAAPLAACYAAMQLAGAGWILPHPRSCRCPP